MVPKRGRSTAHNRGAQEVGERGRMGAAPLFPRVRKVCLRGQGWVRPLVGSSVGQVRGHAQRPFRFGELREVGWRRPALLWLARPHL